MRQAGLSPLTDYPGSDDGWPCTCTSCGRQVSPRFANVRTGQGGCRFCSGVAVDSTVAEHVMRGAGVTPMVAYPGSNQPWTCQCDVCKRQVTPRYINVRNGQGACKFCAQVAVDPDDAKRRMVEVGLLPR